MSSELHVAMSGSKCKFGNLATRQHGPEVFLVITGHESRDVKFGIRIGSDAVYFGSESQNILKLILKSPRFVPFWANLTRFECQI